MERRFPVSTKSFYLTTLFALLLLLAGLPLQQARAGWLIDRARFHASPHGEMSCTECHEDIAEKEKHPDAEGIASTRAERFNPEKCAECHEESVSALNDDSSHAGKELSKKDVARYQRCYVCHDPHHLVRRTDSDIKFAKDRPRHMQCAACHDEQKELPPIPDEEKECWSCHQAPSDEGKESNQKVAALCLNCHGEKRDKIHSKAPLVDPAQMVPQGHGQFDCLTCHPEGAEYGHAEQKMLDCMYCHQDEGRHDEAVAGDAHLKVSCQACHLDGVKAVKAQDGHIVHQKIKAEGASKVHNMLFKAGSGDEESCRRCHNQDNQLGAAAHVLPAKGLLCMPCHTATLQVTDTTTLLTLIGFAIGIIMLFSLWTGGSGAALGGAVFGAVFSCKIVKIITALITEGLLQLSLFKRSPKRWFIHALIFWPFALRFGFGFIALIMSLAFAGDSITWDLINKNHPLTAFFFDLTGLGVLLGVALAFIRRLQKDKSDPVEGLPAQDRVALVLLAVIVILGYFTEGVRIAMTGWPAGSEFAFVGYALSHIMGGGTGAYAYLWYLHAIAWGVFVIYIPFSRMSHIVMGPINAAVNACKEEHHH
jgi:predicted CXXCH cytochrome family protein